MAQKRIPCPHCGEKIMPTAKKCRFCGERLEDTKKKLSIPRLYFFWLSSLIIFLTTLFLVRRVPESFPSIGLIIFIFVVIFGSVAFLALSIDILKEMRSKKAKKFGLISLVTFVAFFGLLINVDAVETSLGITPPSQNLPTVENVQPTPEPPQLSPTPTKAPTKQNTAAPAPATNKITCTGPDGKQFLATQKECDDFNAAWGNAPTPDPNELIHCNISPNCGGGYREMTRASCDRMTCCQINNSWELRDKGQCNTEQQQEADAEWIEFCNDLYDPDDCSTYWETGTSNWYDCRSDAYSGRISCYDNQ